LAATIPQDIATQVLLRQGTPPSGIISAARQNRRDLIVLPTRGLKGLKFTCSEAPQRKSCDMRFARSSR